MDYQNIRGNLGPGIVDAIDYLEAQGFKVMLDTKIEESRNVRGNRRRRTFSNEGRYNLVLALKRTADAGPGDEASSVLLDRVQALEAEKKGFGARIEAETRDFEAKIGVLRKEVKSLKAKLKRATEAKRKKAAPKKTAGA